MNSYVNKATTYLQMQKILFVVFLLAYIKSLKSILNNETILDPGIFQNPDGTAAVGPEGGTIHGPGGITAFIPEGSFDQFTAVQVTMLPDDALTDVTINPELKPFGTFKVDMGSITSNKELKISIPAPDWITPDHQILLAKVINIRGFDELTLSCPAILKDGQIISTSPPFDGVTDSGNYTFVSWKDKDKGTAFVLVDTWITKSLKYFLGDYDFLIPAPLLIKKRIVVTIPVDKLYDLNLTDLEGLVSKTVPVQGPPARGEFASDIPLVTDDITPPSVLYNSLAGATGVLPSENYISIEMSEGIDPESVNQEKHPNAVVVMDKNGNRVDGDFYLAADGKTIIFVPRYGYKYGETYTMNINGIKDYGGNLLAPYSTTFTTFKPEKISEIQVPLAMAIDKYKNYVVVKGWNSSSGVDIVHSSLISIYDVTNPRDPKLTSATDIGGYIKDIKVVPDMGDYLVAVGGRSNQYGYLDLLNISYPSVPKYQGYIYLAWSPSYSGTPPENVPFGGGSPDEVAVIDSNAYVANYGIGIQAIDLTAVTPSFEIAQASAIKGTITGNSYMAVSNLRSSKPDDKNNYNYILAVKNGALQVFDPQLAQLGEISGLNFPYGVTGVGAFPIDTDKDGNLGSFEKNDGDETTEEEETFDLAFVLTSDGIVVVDVTDKHNPKKIEMFPVPTSKIVVDREKRLAYALSGGGISIISLKCLPPMTCPLPSPLNRTNDPRLLYTITDASGMDLVLSSFGDMAYVADYTGGLVKIARLQEHSFKIVSNDEPDKEMKGAVTDGASLLRLKLTVPKSSQSLYANMEWRLTDPQLQNTAGTNMGTLLDKNQNPLSSYKVNFDENGVAEVIYKSPDSFVRSGTSEETNDKERPERQVSVVLSSNTTPSDTIFLDNIRLKRPPVVLVHGLWGKPEAWDKFVPEFNNLKLYGEDEEILRADYYEDGQVRSVVEHTDKLQTTIKNKLADLKRQQFTASKVDVIAHSMGGLLTREYCHQFNAECQSKIRRFVTIDSPHFGSELADLLLVYRDDLQHFPNPFPYVCRNMVGVFVSGMSILGQNVEPHPLGPNRSSTTSNGSAIDYLATGTLITLPHNYIPTGAWAQLPPLGGALSSHTIVGELSEPYDGIDSEIVKAWALVLSPCGFTRMNVFGQGNDRIVPVTSQYGGLSGDNATHYDLEDHFSVRNSVVTIYHIRELLLNRQSNTAIRHSRLSGICRLI